MRDPAIFQHLGPGVAAVEAAHIGEGKLDQAALADDLRQGLRGLRQQLVHEMKAVADVFRRGRIFREPVVGKDEHAVGLARADRAMASIALSRRAQPSKAKGCTPTTMTFAPASRPSSISCSARATPVRAGQAEDENEKIAAAGRPRASRFSSSATISRASSISPLQPRPCTRSAPEQMPIRHDRAFDRLLVGIEDPEILRRPAVQDQLIAHRRAGLAQADDAHAVREKADRPFREKVRRE